MFPFGSNQKKRLEKRLNQLDSKVHYMETQIQFWHSLFQYSHTSAESIALEYHGWRTRCVVELEAPLNTTDGIPEPFLGRAGKRVLAPAHVSIVKDAMLFPPAGVVVAGGQLMTDTCPKLFRTGFRWGGHHVVRDYFKSGKLPDQRKKVDCAISLCCEQVTKFYYHHWIVDALSRLEALEHVSKGYRNCSIFIQKQHAPVVWETLDLLGIDRERVIVMEDDTLYQVTHMIVPSNQRVNSLPLLAMAWLKEKLGVKDQPKDQLLYISRKDATCRRVKGEEELLGALEGFRNIELAGLSFKEQVELFSRAKCVVGPHGSGFTNIMFSKGALLVELFGENIKSGCYYETAVGCGNHYAWWLAGTEDTEQESGDFTVDVTKVVEIVEQHLG